MEERMFCPVCGVESTGLNYCKRCGNNLTLPAVNPASTPQPKQWGFGFGVAIAALSLATAAVALAGLGIVLTFVEDLARQSEVDRDLPKMILVLGIMMVSGISILLGFQIARLIGARQSAPVSQPQPQQLVQPRQIQIPPPPAGVMSVTEHTTRTFNPVNLKDSDTR
jgi:hypothetical protein